MENVAPFSDKAEKAMHTPKGLLLIFLLIAIAIGVVSLFVPISSFPDGDPTNEHPACICYYNQYGFPLVFRFKVTQYGWGETFSFIGRPALAQVTLKQSVGYCFPGCSFREEGYNKTVYFLPLNIVIYFISLLLTDKIVRKKRQKAWYLFFILFLGIFWVIGLIAFPPSAYLFGIGL